MYQLSAEEAYYRLCLSLHAHGFLPKYKSLAFMYEEVGREYRPCTESPVKESVSCTAK